ncbi:MAG TPA: alpha/beta hydrolase [Gammaproteobacteria bacterium]|nr:alpha/beta hydrolase [Gammaproteobacteria bacterium]
MTAPDRAPAVNKALAALAAAFTVIALALPMRGQTFTYVKLDGRDVRMLIAGDGGPTVVFESGWGEPLETWGKVQPAVSRFARTVAYDRAGYGLSDAGPPPRDGRKIATELRCALVAAGAAPPYVLVGASLGGPFVRVFAGLYPGDVASLVLVDPTNDAEGLERGDDPELAALPDTIAQARSSAVPAGVPVVLIDAPGPAELPFATAEIRESRALRREERAAESRAYEAWLAGVPGGRLLSTERSGHNVAQEQPSLVIDAIRQVVAEGRR